MKESELKAFLDGERDAAPLGLAAGPGEDEVLEPDMDEVVTLSRDHLLRLCDGHLQGGLTLPTLQSIAGGLLASDHFAWEEGTDEGELLAEILWSWSSPEEDEELSSETVAGHRRTLADKDARPAPRKF